MTDDIELSSEDLISLVASVKELNSEIHLNDVLNKILHRGCDLTDSPSASIFLDDPGRGLYAAAASGPKSAGLLSMFGEESQNRIPYKGSKAGEVFVSGESLPIASIGSDPGHFKAVDQQLEHHTESMVCVPLVAGDRRIGAVQILNKESGDYTRRDVVLLEHLASHAALAIQNARLIRDLLAHKGLFTSSGLKTADLVRELSAKAHRERMTVLFADMRGFTRLLQSIGDPIDTVAQLNQFLDLLADRVLRHNGYVNKFLGDGVLALFRGLNPEVRGARAAFDIIEGFDELKEKWNKERSEALDFLDVGVGIVTGDVIIGSIGSGPVRDFTAIGALVNLAAAFEADARAGKRILTDRSTFGAIRGIAEADEPTKYEMRKPDQPSGVWYERYHIRRLRSDKEIPPEKDVYLYDVCFSFADEDRNYVKEVADALDSQSIRVFFDDFKRAETWGKDLYSYLDNVFRKSARYCVVFLSKHYAMKAWTDHERRSAQARALEEYEEYILPARFDDTEVPGIPDTIGYIDLRKTSPQDLSKLIVQKLQQLPSQRKVPRSSI